MLYSLFWDPQKVTPYFGKPPYTRLGYERHILLVAILARVLLLILKILHDFTIL